MPDLEGGVAHAIGLLDRGVGLDELVLGLLVPAQVEVGRRWEAGEWTVGQEQQASSVVDNVLSAAGRSAAIRPQHGWVVVGCVEEEWHALPARMVAEVLRSRGWKITFLGASTPAPYLRAFLSERSPDAVLLSCSMASFLGGAFRCIEAASDVGVPVIAGGRAFGTDDTRALRLGAGAWAPDPVSADELLHRRPSPGARPRVRLDRGYAELDSRRSEVVHHALGELFLQWPELAACDDQGTVRLREYLNHIVGHVMAALLLEDEAIMAEQVEWLARLAAGRVGLPPLTVVMAAVETSIGESVPEARKLLAEAIADLHGRPSVPPPAASAADWSGSERSDAIRARARMAAHRLRLDGASGRPPVTAPVPPFPEPGEGVGEGALDEEALLQAARERCDRIIADAEAAAGRIRDRALADAEATAAEAERAAAELVSRAEHEGLALLADAEREAMGQLDRVASERARLLAAARSEAARLTADASRIVADATAEAARITQEAHEEGERQLTQAGASATDMLARAHSEAANLMAEAQAARAEAAGLREAADAAIETDTRRLLEAAQRDCEALLAAARGEADTILRAAARDLSSQLGTTADPAKPAAAVPSKTEGPAPKRRSRPRRT